MARISGTNPKPIKVKVNAEQMVMVKSKTAKPVQVDKNKRRY